MRRGRDLIRHGDYRRSTGLPPSQKGCDRNSYSRDWTSTWDVSQASKMAVRTYIYIYRAGLYLRWIFTPSASKISE